MTLPPPSPPAGAAVLVVEDEADLLFLLRTNLTKVGWTVTACRSAKDARTALPEARPDVLLLDVNLGLGATGFELLRGWRAAEVWTPAVFLTARAAEADRLAGFAAGGDDYVTKPFSMAELLARLAAIVRRARAATKGAIWRGAGVEVDFDRYRLTREGAQHALTYLEAELLRYLVERPNVAVSRSELLNEVWGEGEFPTTRTIDMHVLNLRKKLEPEAGGPRHLITVHGVGYKFVP